MSGELHLEMVTQALFLRGRPSPEIRRPRTAMNSGGYLESLDKMETESTHSSS